MVGAEPDQLLGLRPGDRDADRARCRRPGPRGVLRRRCARARDDHRVGARCPARLPQFGRRHRDRIDFAAVDGGTRVTVVQSLVRDDGKAFYFWPRVIRWIPAWVARRSTAPRTPRELDRLTIALSYDDPSAAARWLHTVFGLDSWDAIPAEGDNPSWIELNVGSAAVLLVKRTDPRPTTTDHNIWVYVDDLDAHFAHAQAGGAKILTEIHHYGYTSYEAEDLEGPLDLRPSPAHDGVTEHALTGGRITHGVVRVGDTVRRPASARSAFTRDLLQLLDRRGFDAAPRYLGRDDESRDILTYLDGWVPAKFQRWADDQVAAVGVLLRAFHDATHGTSLAAHHDVVCHHDPGPTNVVFRDGVPAALIDFDTAEPGSRLEDIGYAAWTWCIASKYDDADRQAAVGCRWGR